MASPWSASVAQRIEQWPSKPPVVVRLHLEARRAGGWSHPRSPRLGPAGHPLSRGLAGFFYTQVYRACMSNKTRVAPPTHQGALPEAWRHLEPAEIRGMIKDLTQATREARSAKENIAAEIQKARQEALVIAKEFTKSLDASSDNALTEWRGMFGEVGGKLLAKASDEMLYEIQQVAGAERRRLVEQFAAWVDKLIRALAFGLDGHAVMNDSSMGTEEVKAWSTVLAAGAGGKTPGLPETVEENGAEWAKELFTKTLPKVLKELDAIRNTPSDAETVEVPPEAYPILFEMFDKETGKVMQRTTIAKAGTRVKVKEHEGRKVIIRMTLKNGQVIERED